MYLNNLGLTLAEILFKVNLSSFRKKKGPEKLNWTELWKKIKRKLRNNNVKWWVANACLMEPELILYFLCRRRKDLR